MRAKLTWVASTSGTKRRFRTEAVEGNLVVFPVVGGSCIVIAPPIDPGATYRQASTSRIVSIVSDVNQPMAGRRLVVFETLNSRYELEVFAEEGRA